MGFLREGRFLHRERMSLKKEKGFIKRQRESVFYRKLRNFARERRLFF